MPKLPKNAAEAEQRLMLAARLDAVRGGEPSAIMEQYDRLDVTLTLDPEHPVARVKTEQGEARLDLNQPEYAALKEEALRIYGIFHPQKRSAAQATGEPRNLETAATV